MKLTIIPIIVTRYTLPAYLAILTICISIEIITLGYIDSRYAIKSQSGINSNVQEKKEQLKQMEKWHFALHFTEVSILILAAIQLALILKNSKPPYRMAGIPSAASLLRFSPFRRSNSQSVDITRDMENIQMLVSFCVSISKNNAEIAQLLYNLKVSKPVINNAEITEKVEEILQYFRQNELLTEHLDITAKLFSTITGIDEKSMELFGRTERLLLVLLSLKIETKQISALLNTSNESIRTRKMYLRRKVAQHNIAIGEQLTEAFSVPKERKS